MSDNAFAGIALACIFGFFTIRAIAESWRDRGMAKWRAIEAKHQAQQASLAAVPAAGEHREGG